MYLKNRIGAERRSVLKPKTEWDADKRRLPSGEDSLVRMVLVLILGRFSVNIIRRFLYPFVPTIGEQLRVSAQSVQGVISAQSAMGLLGPVFGAVSERYGRKRIIVGAFSLLCLATTTLALFPRFWVFVVVMLGVGLVKILYDPTSQAYIGDRIPYRRRGVVMGIIELNWSMALCFIAPVGGFLLAGAGLQSVFILFAGLALLALLVMRFCLPADLPENGALRTGNPIAGLRALARNPAGLGAIGFALLFIVANEVFWINYGLWMKDSFDLELTALGLVTVTVAVAEVTGELLVIGIVDRVGKRRLALVGATGAALAYVVIPQLAFSLTAALAGVFILFVFVETAIVAALPLFTELMPDARAVMMSGVMSAQSLGRLSGGALGGLLYALTGDFALMGSLSTVIGIGAALLLWRFVREIVPLTA